MAILWKIDGAGDVHANIRIKRGRLPRVQYFGGDAQLPGLFRHLRLFVERVLRLAQHQQTAFHQAETISGQISELLEACAAGELEITQKRGCAAHTPGRGSAPEPVSPTHQVPVGPRLDVEG